MELVSIIVAIYKVEPYLRQCLDSIVMQTYKNLDIILVDDGSPDQCGKICDEYAEEDSRIRVIHKKNAGLGMARNSGLEIACGKYIIFIDSDDWLELNMVERLAISAQENDCDYVVGGFAREIAGKNAILSHPCDNPRIIEQKEIGKEVLFPILGAESNNIHDIDREMCVWTNLYKREIIHEQNIRFVSEREYLSEDLFFNIHYIMNCRRAMLLPDHLYHYRINNVSLTNAFRLNRFSLLCKLYETECSILKDYGILSDVWNRVDRTMIMKTRNTVRILVNSKNVSTAQRKVILKQIISSPVLQDVLRRYPIESYSLRLRIPAELMKRQYTKLLWIEERLRYILKRML